MTAPKIRVVFDVNVFVDALVGSDSTFPLIREVPPPSSNAAMDAFSLAYDGFNFALYVSPHILRNAGGPALTTLGMQFVGMMGGAVIVEAIFAIPGLGPFATMATKASDIPAVMGLVVVTALIVIVVNLVIDLLTAALNPKVRLS
ncbi:MAG: hypothetical protein RLZZ603_1242 [Actinomycetota bacterium]